MSSRRRDDASTLLRLMRRFGKGERRARARRPTCLADVVMRVPSTHAARLAEAVAALAEASAAGDPAGAEAALVAVEHRALDLGQRRSVPFRQIVALFQRDCWTCRYCGGRTIAPPVLRVLSSMYPERFPHHPNWKAGRVHPAYLLLSASLDHVEPGARGGSWIDPANLVTACWPCNSGKADFTLEEVGWDLLSEGEAQSDWDGLTRSYHKLWLVAGQPDPRHHERWLRFLA